MSSENKTQNTSEPEVEVENQPVESASQEIETKIEIPTEAVLENEEKVEIEPEVEPQTKQETPTLPQPQIQERIIYKTDPNIIQKLLNKARAKIQERKQKKLDKIMTLFETKHQITNEDVQKLLRTTKRTATRYFDLLEQGQKITQVGKTGKAVFYTKK
jgi:predicted HTH transcriptional regulator